MENLEQTEINYMGVTYTFQKKSYENQEDFYHICWLTAKQLPKTPLQIQKANQMAQMWYNQKKYNCKYAESLQIELSKLDLLSFDF